MLYVTGDTHGEQARFINQYSQFEKMATEQDILFVCGDFGFIFNDTYQERSFLTELAEKPYTICFVDGNHENFQMLNSFPVSVWNGGKVHVIRYSNDNAKIIHLMRGQIYHIEDKSIMAFGGAYSIDKSFRKEGFSWWAEEMPNDEEYKEAIYNLEKENYKVDYILTHTAPESTMQLFHPYHEKEKPINVFLEYVRENVQHKHWYFGHMHEDRYLWRNQTVLWFQIRNMEDNSIVD